MNKKEVGCFLTAVTGRLLCSKWEIFHKWAEERLDRPIFTSESSSRALQRHCALTELNAGITDVEWAAIADFFIKLKEGKKNDEYEKEDKIELGDA